jgi:hypothetical protein
MGPTQASHSFALRSPNTSETSSLAGWSFWCLLREGALWSVGHALHVWVMFGPQKCLDFLWWFDGQGTYGIVRYSPKSSIISNFLFWRDWRREVGLNYMYLLTTLHQNCLTWSSVKSKFHAWSLSGSLNSRLLVMMGLGYPAADRVCSPEKELWLSFWHVILLTLPTLWRDVANIT